MTQRMHRSSRVAGALVGSAEWLSVGFELGVAGPEVISGEIDVAPAQRREMGEDCLRHRNAVPAQRIQGTAEIDGVPQHDGRGDQCEPAGAMLLGLGAAITHAAEAVEAHGPGQCVARFALVQLRSGTPAQLRIVPLRLSRIAMTSPLCVSNSRVVVPPPAAGL